MKKLVRMAAFFAATAVLFAGCDGDGENDEGGKARPAAPEIVLQNGDIDKPQEITQDMLVKVDVEAPGTVRNFEIEIESECLTAKVLEDMNLAAKMNLVSPASDAMAAALAGMGFPVKDKVKDATELSFDISTLVPLIALIYDKTSDHKFHLTVTDAANQTVTKTLWFHLTGANAIINNRDADLWANTASLTVKSGVAGDLVFEYKESTATEWQTVVVTDNGDETYKAAIAPVWETSKNAVGIDVHTIKAGTGVFAGKTYECRAKVDGEVIAEEEFSTADGDVIPNGDMSGWGTRFMKDNILGTEADVAFPNADGGSFWGCGNNAVTTALCVSTTEKVGVSEPAAKLASIDMMVLASGNLFTGSFDYASFTGMVDFGQKYTYSARPAALKLKYHASVGLVDKLRAADDDHVEGVAEGDPDKARIFVAVVDWEEPHQVTSGIQKTTGAWDPEKGADVVTEGKVIGYGSLWITESTEGDAMQDLQLDIQWYDKSAKPAGENYSLVISCAANAYGDYMTGCSTNVMYVDDFEWVY